MTIFYNILKIIQLYIRPSRGNSNVGSAFKNSGGGEKGGHRVGKIWVCGPGGVQGVTIT